MPPAKHDSRSSGRLRLARILAATALLVCACRAPYQGAPLDPELVASEYAATTVVLPHGGSRADWVRVALEQREELRVAAAEVEEARAAVLTAGTRPNPSLAFTPEFVPGAGRPWILAWALALPLDLLGTRALRSEVAERELDVSMLALPRAAWAVRCEVVEALDALHFARVRAVLAEERVALERERGEHLQALVTAGALATPARREAERALAQAEFARSARTSELEAASTELARALGVPRALLATDELALPAPGEPPPEPEAARARELTLANRLDLAVLLAQYATAEAELRLACARRFPGLTLGPGWSYDQGDHKLALGLTLELPIFDRNQGPIAAAEARRSTLAARFRELAERALAEVEGARVAHALARARVAEARRVLELAAEAHAQAARRLTAGVADRAELLDARRAELEASELVNEAEELGARSARALERVLERPLEEEA